MNERIKELAEQAGNHYRTTTPGADTFTNPVYGVIPKKFLDKFAELIVRECIVTIQMGITRDGHQTEKYTRSMKHIKDIKQHFGVEDAQTK